MLSAWSLKVFAGLGASIMIKAGPHMHFDINCWTTIMMLDNIFCVWNACSQNTMHTPQLSPHPLMMLQMTESLHLTLYICTS